MPDPDRARPADPDRPLLDLVTLAVAAGDLDAAKRALALLEDRRRSHAPNVVPLAAKKRVR